MSSLMITLWHGCSCAVHTGGNGAFCSLTGSQSGRASRQDVSGAGFPWDKEIRAPLFPCLCPPPRAQLFHSSASPSTASCCHWAQGYCQAEAKGLLEAHKELAATVTVPVQPVPS